MIAMARPDDTGREPQRAKDMLQALGAIQQIADALGVSSNDADEIRRELERVFRMASKPAATLSRAPQTKAPDALSPAEALRVIKDEGLPASFLARLRADVGGRYSRGALASVIERRDRARRARAARRAVAR